MVFTPRPLPWALPLRGLAWCRSQRRVPWLAACRPVRRPWPRSPSCSNRALPRPPAPGRAGAYSVASPRLLPVPAVEVRRRVMSSAPTAVATPAATASVGSAEGEPVAARLPLPAVSPVAPFGVTPVRCVAPPVVAGPDPEPSPGLAGVPGRSGLPWHQSVEPVRRSGSVRSNHRHIWCLPAVPGPSGATGTARTPGHWRNRPYPHYRTDHTRKGLYPRSRWGAQKGSWGAWRPGGRTGRSYRSPSGARSASAARATRVPGPHTPPRR